MAAELIRYPHLLPVDAELWHAHFLTLGANYNQIDYDVRVGQGRDPGDAFDDTMRQMALSLSTRRVDAVGHSNTGIDIIEVTHSAGLTAIGQLIAYPILYAQTYPTTRPIRPVLVAGELQTDILPVLTRLRIQYFLYPLSDRPVTGRSLSP